LRRDLTVAQTQLNNAKTTIANHVAQIATLNAQFSAPEIAFIQGLTTAQMAFISGLSTAQCTFLSNVEQIGVPADYPLSQDGSSGSTWVTGERSFINDIVICVNDLISKMQNQHMMS
jgi:hypothetical protein